MVEKKKKLKPWTTLSKKIVYNNNWFSVSDEKFITKNNNIGNYFVINTKNQNRSVMIVPVQDNEIILIKQYRYPTKRWCLEVPGGAVENDTTTLQSAKNELAEEIGYKGKLKKIGEYCPWSGPAAEICHVFLATNLVHIGQNLEEMEDLTIIRVKIPDIYKMLDEGKFTEGQTIAALSFARKYLLPNKLKS